MTKKCKVLWKNDQVAVVDFDGALVQIPSNGLTTDEVSLKKEGDSFYLNDEDETDNKPKRTVTKENI